MQSSTLRSPITEADFLEFVRDSANGFISVSLPLKGNTELCVKVS